MFENLQNLTIFDASSNHLSGNIHLSYIGESMQHFNLSNNDYNSSRYLNGSDDYIRFDSVSGWDLNSDNPNVTIVIDTSLQCDPTVYCLSTTYKPINRNKNICWDQASCENTCACTSDVCDAGYQTEDSFSLCSILSELEGLFWFELGNKNYCDGWTDCFVCTVNNNSITEINLSQRDLQGKLNYRNITSFPESIEVIDLSMNAIFGNFDLLSLCGDHNCVSLSTLNISGNMFNGTLGDSFVSLADVFDVSDNEFTFIGVVFDNPTTVDLHSNDFQRM